MTASTPRRLLGFTCGQPLYPGWPGYGDAANATIPPDAVLYRCRGDVYVEYYRDPMHPRIRLVLEWCESCGREGTPERARDWERRHARAHAARAAARGDAA